MKQSKHKVIGVTGGVGAGKSEVLRYLSKKDYCIVYELDKIAHQLQMPGASCYELMVLAYGKEILNAAGMIDREKLGELVFSNKEALQKLNDIIHPQVMLWIREEIKKQKDNISLIVIEGALLIEAGYKECCDEFWYIRATQNIRQMRVIESRSYSVEKFDGIQKNQLDDTTFMKWCSVCIDNSSDKKSLYTNIENQLKILLGE